jgi:restriction endonuclease S subunit
MGKFKTISLSDTAYFELFIGKRVLKKDVRTPKGDIPIYSANVFHPIGYGNKSNIPDLSRNYIIWGIDGDFDFNLMEKGKKFVSTDHCGAIKIKDDNLIPQYLLYFLYNVRDKYGFDRALRASLKNMKSIEIKIPVKENGDFDLDKQNSIANGYELIKEIKSKLSENIKEVDEAKIKLMDDYKESKEKLIPELFKISLGSSKYDHRYFDTHKGQYPVYSAQTTKFGEIAKINTYEYDTEGLTWTIDGYAGKVFHRKGKFSMTTHCGLLQIKEEVKGKLDYEFLKYLLDNELSNYAVGEGNKRIKKTHISRIGIRIPIDKNGNYNIEKQREIAREYRIIEQTKSSVKNELKRIIETAIEF